MYDFHIHSSYSIDSQTPIEKIILSAISKNMKHIAITDHIDLEDTLRSVDIKFNVDDFFEEMNLLKKKYEDKLKISLGVEIGIQPHLFNKYNEIINSHDFDFVLMSVHTVNRYAIHEDNFPNIQAPMDAMRIYFEQMLYCVENFNNYSVLGHLDYMDRYFDDRNSIPKFEEYKELVVPVLKTIIKNKKGIEMNTAGLRYGLGYFHPKKDILKLYKDLGGEIITIGSDSHVADTIGFGYDEVISTLKEIGFSKIYTFENRKEKEILI